MASTLGAGMVRTARDWVWRLLKSGDAPSVDT